MLPHTVPVHKYWIVGWEAVTLDSRKGLLALKMNEMGFKTFRTWDSHECFLDFLLVQTVKSFIKINRVCVCVFQPPFSRYHLKPR